MHGCIRKLHSALITESFGIRTLPHSPFYRAICYCVVSVTFKVVIPETLAYSIAGNGSSDSGLWVNLSLLALLFMSGWFHLGPPVSPRSFPRKAAWGNNLIARAQTRQLINMQCQNTLSHGIMWYTIKCINSEHHKYLQLHLSMKANEFPLAWLSLEINFSVTKCISQELFDVAQLAYESLIYSRFTP